MKSATLKSIQIGDLYVNTQSHNGSMHTTIGRACNFTKNGVTLDECVRISFTYGNTDNPKITKTEKKVNFSKSSLVEYGDVENYNLLVLKANVNLQN